MGALLGRGGEGVSGDMGLGALNPLATPPRAPTTARFARQEQDSGTESRDDASESEGFAR
jgi:hypothetical protein